MRKLILLLAAVAALTMVALAPSNAQASWLSQALRGYYAPRYEAPVYSYPLPSDSYYDPGYTDYAPDYGYYYNPGSTYYLPSYNYPYVAPYWGYGYSSRYYGV